MAPRKKIAKRPKTKTKSNDEEHSRSAAKAWLADMPLDLLLEIFSHLDPSGLLRLSRTSESFRSFLLKRTTSAHIWKASFKEIYEFNGMPPCPSFLNEPQYAQLAFDESCSGCGETTTERTGWMLRARYCCDCAKSRTSSDNTPEVRVRIKNTPIISSLSLPMQDSFWRVSDLEDFTTQFQAAKTIEETHKITQQWREFKAQISTFVLAIQSWEHKMAEAERVRLLKLKQERLRNVIKRLKDLGWTDEMIHVSESSHSPLAKLKQVDREEELDDKGWKKICPHIIKFMNTHKETRLERERISSHNGRFYVVQGMLRSFISNSAKKEIFPHAVDICCMPEVQTILDVDVNNYCEQVLRDQLLPLLPEICARWRQDIKSSLLEWTSERINHPEGINPFELAITIYRCKRCSNALLYPAVLAHACLHENWSPTVDHKPKKKPKKLKKVLVDFQQSAIEAFRHRPFSLDALDLDTWSLRIESAIQVCGLDPKTATCDQMDEADVRLTCKLCRQNDGRCSLLTWRTALDHSITSHRKLDPEEEAWDKVSKDATAKAKELEIVSLRLAKVEYDDSPFWMCGKCTAHSNLPRRDVISHLRRRHSVKHAVDEKDIYRKIDSPPMLLKPVLLLSDSLKRERLKPQELDWLSEGRAGFHSF